MTGHLTGPWSVWYCPGNATNALNQELPVQGVDPNIGGVRVSGRPILGPNAAPEYSQELAAGHEEPHGIIDKVKQLVGLAPAEPSSAVSGDIVLVPLVQTSSELLNVLVSQW